MLELLSILSFLLCNILVIFGSVFSGCTWLIIAKVIVSLIATISYAVRTVQLYMKDKRCSYISYKLAGFTLALAMFVSSFDMLV